MGVYTTEIGKHHKWLFYFFLPSSQFSSTPLDGDVPEEKLDLHLTLPSAGKTEAEGPVKAKGAVDVNADPVSQVSQEISLNLWEMQKHLTSCCNLWPKNHSSQMTRSLRKFVIFHFLAYTISSILKCPL